MVRVLNYTKKCFQASRASGKYPVAIIPPTRNVYNWITTTRGTGLSGSIYTSWHAHSRLCSAHRALTDCIPLKLNRNVLNKESQP